MSDTDAARVTRWAVHSKDTPLASIIDWHPYEDRAEAERMRTYFDRTVPTFAPHRVVRVDMNLTVEGAGDEDGPRS